MNRYKLDWYMFALLLISLLVYVSRLVTMGENSSTDLIDTCSIVVMLLCCSWFLFRAVFMAKKELKE